VVNRLQVLRVKCVLPVLQHLDWLWRPLGRSDDGTVARSAATTAKPTGGFAGVFLGCEFINPSTGQLQFQQNFVAGTTVTSGFITAYVCDDPDALFQVAVVSGTTVVTGVQFTSVGNNATIVNNTGITAAGNSQVAFSPRLLRPTRCQSASLTLCRIPPTFLAATRCILK
jgi:hypothetical protein